LVAAWCHTPLLCSDQKGAIHLDQLSRAGDGQRLGRGAAPADTLAEHWAGCSAYIQYYIVFVKLLLLFGCHAHAQYFVVWQVLFRTSALRSPTHKKKPGMHTMQQLGLHIRGVEKKRTAAGVQKQWQLWTEV
jgi:hypothetical protein